MASILTKFFGRTASEGAAFALGTAVGPALHPAVRELENEAWSKYPTRPIDAGTAAAIVAEAVELREWGAGQAAATGIDGDRFDAMVAEAREAPGTSELFQLWRRGLIDTAAFEHGLAKAKLEPRWNGPLEGLRDVLLAPADLAMMRQQGFIDADRQRAESDLQGVDAERADLLFEASGLPPGVETGLDLLRRGIVDEATFAQIVREGHTKTKYTGDLAALKHHVLSAQTVTTLRLKGWISADTSYALGEDAGYDQAAMDRMYLAAGRPAAPGQMATAAARGIDGPAGRPVDREQFIKAIAESDIRPEYGPMLWETRFLYPPLFQITRLVTAGTITADTGAEWARKDRYPPEVVDALHKAWTQAPAASTDPHVTKAQNQLWTRTHSSFVLGDATEAEARAKLAALGVAADAVATVLALWNQERSLTRKELTAAQLKKAYQKLVTNPATGEKWTRDDVIGELTTRGMTLNDAITFVDTPSGK